jgi:hypothetical protein
LTIGDSGLKIEARPRTELVLNLQSEGLMYLAYGLLQPGSDFTLDEAVRRLAARFPGWSVTRAGNEVHVTQGDWEFKLQLNAEGYVADESEGLSGKIAGVEPAEAAAVAASDRRAELWSDTQDPFVEHLGDFGAAVEVLKSFRGLIAVDPNEHALM